MTDRVPVNEVHATRSRRWQRKHGVATPTAHAELVQRRQQMERLTRELAALQDQWNMQRATTFIRLLRHRTLEGDTIAETPTGAVVQFRVPRNSIWYEVVLEGHEDVYGGEVRVTLERVTNRAHAVVLMADSVAVLRRTMRTLGVDM